MPTAVGSKRCGTPPLLFSGAWKAVPLAAV